MRFNITMWKYQQLFILLSGVLILFVCSSTARKFRICIVDGRGIFKTSGKFCPLLETTDSPIECVLGIDRLDCLRKISKEIADFSVFTPEDLLAALNLHAEVLITNELKYNEDNFEYEIVAVVNKFSNISNIYDVGKKRLCLPGYGVEPEISKVLANYFEATVVPPSCDPNLSLLENRLKASDEYFEALCKAGPWIADSRQDRILKQKYPNMCSLCDDPFYCNQHDKYWGRRGSLYCLTDGRGEISWARLDDVNSHFGVVPGNTPKGVDIQNYMLLCRDGTLMPINSTNPCIWVAKPWSVVASKRTSAPRIQSFVASLSQNIGSRTPWQTALFNLIETLNFDIVNVDPIMSVDTYLSKAPGFLSAHSFSGCHPPRTLRICTTSNIENAKCNWLREAAAVSGVEPDIDCIKANNKTHCFKAVKENFADVVFVHPDLQFTATRDYDLKTLLYETSRNNDLYMTGAVVHASSDIKDLKDLQGKRACFPSYNGIAYNTILHELRTHNLLDNSICPYEESLGHFFGSTCIPGLNTNSKSSINQLCYRNLYDGEKGAFRCLAENKADVAFIDLKTIQNYTDGMSQEKWAENLKSKNFRVLCFNDNNKCSLSTMSYSQAMVRHNITKMFEHESLNTLTLIDRYFGRNNKTITPALVLYGPYDGQHNILFSDNTEKLNTNLYYKHNMQVLPINYTEIIRNIPKVCVPNKSNYLGNNIYLSVIVCLYFLIKSFLS